MNSKAHATRRLAWFHMMLNRVLLVLLPVRRVPL